MCKINCSGGCLDCAPEDPHLKLIGYTPKEKIPRKEGDFRFPNLKVYKTEAMALRYAHVKDVVPVYVSDLY